ncbi:response regulator [Candidatus Riflebacteria bacterium]
MRKILLVDDSNLALRMISAKLELLEDCEIKTAKSGEEAQKVLPEFRPDLVLTDNIMDGISGVELCGWIKKQPDFKHIFTCILTAEKKEIIHKIQGLELGADDYLFKDISTSELVAKVNSFLRISHLQKELHETIEVRDRFFSFIVHELRTPLTAIMGYTQFWDYPNTTPEAQSKYIEKIKVNSRRILETVNDILEISKLEAGKVNIEPTEFDIRDVACDVVGEIEILAQKKGLEVHNDINSQTVFLDKSIMKTILTNFLNNSIKYTKQGQIRLWSEIIDGDTLKLGATDTGSGIGADFIPHVFDSFSREKKSIKKVVGSGIGMSLCANLIKSLNGSIHVESEGTGKGSTFYILVKTRLETRDTPEIGEHSK